MAATESPEALMACGTRDLGATAEHTVGSGAAGATASQGEDQDTARGLRLAVTSAEVSV